MTQDSILGLAEEILANLKDAWRDLETEMAGKTILYDLDAGRARNAAYAQRLRQWRRRALALQGEAMAPPPSSMAPKLVATGEKAPVVTKTLATDAAIAPICGKCRKAIKQGRYDRYQALGAIALCKNCQNKINQAA